MTAPGGSAATGSSVGGGTTTSMGETATMGASTGTAGSASTATTTGTGTTTTGTESNELPPPQSPTTDPVAEGPCTTPPVRIDVVVDTPFDICTAQPPIRGSFPFSVRMSCDGQPCPDGAFAPVDRDAGYSFVWDSQLIDVGAPVCTDGVNGSCTTPTPVALCAFDDPEASQYLPTNEQGQVTMLAYARLVTLGGNCSNDLLTIQVVVDPNVSSVVTIRSSDFTLPQVPETVECAGTTCNGATEYCRAEYVVGENGGTLTDGFCVPYPTECADDHTCECVLPVRPDGVGCADTGLYGSTQVIDNP